MIQAQALGNIAEKRNDSVATNVAQTSCHMDFSNYRHPA
jgi:hypothetical protein